MGKNKEKKIKPVYIDDGSSIANMSDLRKPKAPRLGAPRPNATFKEQVQTYIAAVKMMFLPMETQEKNILNLQKKGLMLG